MQNRGMRRIDSTRRACGVACAWACRCALQGPVSAKACGEPPLLLSCAALLALQRATAAARKHVESILHAAPAGGPPSLDANSGDGAPSSGAAGFQALLAPATVERVRAACGSWRVQDVLAKLAAV